MPLTLTRITLPDGSTVDAIPTIQDTLAFESVLRKNRSWGPLADNSIRLVMFRAWSAATRAGTLTLTWDEFTSGPTAAVNVEMVDPAAEGDDQGDDLEVPGVGLDIAQVQPGS